LNGGFDGFFFGIYSRELKDPELIISAFCSIVFIIQINLWKQLEDTSTRANGGGSNYNGQSVVVGRMGGLDFEISAKLKYRMKGAL